LSENTTYEQLMAAKLDQLPVPDMADSVWCGIEMQLDALTNVPHTPEQRPDLTRTVWYCFAGIVAVALLWWYFSHKAHAPKVTLPPKPLPETHAPLPVEPLSPQVEENSHVSNKPAQKKNMPIVPVEIKKDTVSYRGAQKDSIRVDSAANQVLPSMKADSPAVQKNKPTLPDVDLYEIRQPPPSRGKKHKGVKGITNDEYKITASKDSAKKKD